MKERGSRVAYSSPKEAVTAEHPPQHRFDIVVEGKKVGSATVDYFSKPIPFYQLTSLVVDSVHRGNGYSSEILESFEQFLRERNKPGILSDDVKSDNPAQGLYQRRGWVLVQESIKTYVYNWPQNVPLSILDGYSHRYNKMLNETYGTLSENQSKTDAQG